MDVSGDSGSLDGSGSHVDQHLPLNYWFSSPSAESLNAIYDSIIYSPSNYLEGNLELEELVRGVGSRLSEDKVIEHLKTRNCSAEAVSVNEESDICVICQEEYEKGASIAGLNCRHQYHVECIKNWLLQKNNCPICKATAIS